MLTLNNFNLPLFILSSMIMPREQLGFPCLLTKVFTYFGIELETETPSVGKERFRSTSVNRMFLPRNDFDKIVNGESKAKKLVEED